MRYLVNISYDGMLFYGSQKQKNQRTVLGEVEKVISKILNKETKVVGCSRTDRKVHANSYYFHFDSDKVVNINSLNKLLPEDIIVNSINVVDDSFHCRYSAKTKEYKYIVNTGKLDIYRRNYLYNYQKNINLTLVNKAIKYFIGEKDYKAFSTQNEKENTIRNITSFRVEKDNDIYTFYIKGNGFLRYMVRNIIGFILDVNEGKYKLEDIESVINSKDRTKIGKSAPSSGLYLNEVEY